MRVSARNHPARLFLGGVMSFCLALIIQLSTGFAAAQDAPESCGPPYQISWPAANPVWSFCWTPPDNSSGVDGSGIELRNVSYKGKAVLRQAHIPVLNVHYDPGGCGGGPSLSYRDWQNSPMPFEANNALAIGYAEPSEPPKTVCDHPGTDAGQFSGVAVEKGIDKLILTTQLQAGHYRYIQTWTFYLDGTIEPRLAFTAINSPCTTKPHDHHAYWRFDFDIDGPNDDVVEELNGSTWKIRASETSRKNAPGRMWRVRDKRTGNGYIVEPGAHDGIADNWGAADIWALLYQATELDDGGAVAGPGGDAIHLGNYLSGANINGRNVVLWTHAMHRHATGIGCQLVGPTLKPFGLSSSSASPTPAFQGTPTPTATPVLAGSPSPTATPVGSATPTPTSTPIGTATPAASATPTPLLDGDNPCCGKKPAFVPFAGPVALATHSQNANAPTALVIWDLTYANLAGALVGTQWKNSSSPPTQSFSQPGWSALGTVFGITLDDKGNVYLSATKVYSAHAVSGGILGPGGGYGDILKLDANSGAPSRLVQTDSAAHTYVTGATRMPNTGPGLGNIHFSCTYQKLYVTNFEDGNIYCINPTGGPGGTASIDALWDHGHNLPTAILFPGMTARTAIEDDDNITSNPGAPFTQLSRRAWAVQVYNGRCYYGIWNEDMSRPSATVSNEIWSVALNSSGNFVGPAKVEIVVPPLTTQIYSNPVADISFDSGGKMLVAERGMSSDTGWSAHDARVLEYAWTGSNWTQPVLNRYDIGNFVYLSQKANAAGGCDYDFSPGGRMWATGNLLLGGIYGLQGAPMGGGVVGPTNSLLIDLDNNVTGGEKGNVGDVEVTCPSSATPTPTPTPTLTPTPTPAGNTCCGAKPPLQGVPNYATTYGTFTGQIAVATMRADLASGPSVVIWDLTNQATAPVGAAWNGVVNPPTSFYTHPAWAKASIGDVFGLTLDKSGNIYVTTSTSYGTNVMGSSSVLPGTPGRGDIYRLDANNGTASRFVQSINNSTYQSSSPNKLPNTGPGLGNIHYSCVYDKFYVSNFEDGLIYRIDGNGNILSRWDHGHNLPTAIPPSPALDDTDLLSGNSTPPFTQLGRRVWAVQDWSGRLYYSIWGEHGGGSGGVPNDPPNEIWSIGLTSTGDFTGSARREVLLAAFNPPTWDFSNPISDISFRSSGEMLLAGRTMGSNTSTGTNFAPLLEYTWNGSLWIQAVPNKYKVGSYGGFGCSAGGCDYDEGPNGRVWATGNAIGTSTSSAISGLQGLPFSGGVVPNSILIDVDNDIIQGDKARSGDVEIPCSTSGASSTATPTATPSPTASAKPTATPSATATPVSSATPTPSPSGTPTATPSATKSPTATATPSLSSTPTATPSATKSPTATATPSLSSTPTATPSATKSPTATATPSLSSTPTATPSATKSPTATATPSLSSTPTATPSSTKSPTATPSPSTSSTVTPTPSPATPTPTPAASCVAIIKDVICKTDGSFTLTFSVTNNTGQSVTTILLTPPAGSVFTLNPQMSVPPGGSLANGASIDLSITLTGAQPKETVCILVTFMNKQGCVCTMDVCVILPDCCATTSKDASKIECNKDGTYTYLTQITNNSGHSTSYIYLYPPAGVTMTPNSFTEPGGLVVGDAFQTPPIVITGAQPGEFCFDISLHEGKMLGCCMARQCITLPVCK
jgi:hypothetical protein